jgi:hypothetical protein
MRYYRRRKLKLKPNIFLMVVWMGVFNISFASAAEEDFYGWQSFTLAGDMRKVSPALDKVRWNVMSQTRLGNKHKELTEYLLFAQVGYQLSDSLSVWLGYTHDWLTPLNKEEYQEHRSYQDLLWDRSVGPGLLRLRTRFEQRFKQAVNNSDVAWRIRQMIEYRWSLPFLSQTSLVISEEPFFLLNNSSWGQAGTSENRVSAMLDFKLDQHTHLGLGYLNQYLFRTDQDNQVNHTLLVNMAFNF